MANRQFCFTDFLGYLCIGLPLAVLPVYIHKTLGFSEIIAGVIISLQYVTTFLVRGIAGKIVDTKGPKLAVIISMSNFLLSGILLFIAFHYEENRMLSLTLLAITRLITGCAEGMVGASPINWAMLVVGDQHTATAISYNGIASYGALALGAPLGVIISKNFGITTISICISIVALLGLMYTLFQKSVVGNSKSEPIPFLKVLGLVTPYGICLSLAGLGFGDCQILLHYTMTILTGRMPLYV
ncbi:MFS transporter [Flavobacterium sediminis]|uniref:MFS transporter n=1 Tax=Flavobacterium sediminis TaxID=2201181 RepID=UPI0037430A5C